MRYDLPPRHRGARQPWRHTDGIRPRLLGLEHRPVRGLARPLRHQDRHPARTSLGQRRHHVPRAHRAALRPGLLEPADPLARRTGFDLESLLFSFAIGGIVIAAYDVIFETAPSAPMAHEQGQPRHRPGRLPGGGPADSGRIAFVEDYDLHVAQHLVQGVDVWLNTSAMAGGTGALAGRLSAIRRPPARRSRPAGRAARGRR
jgi:hypothetical protein